jgi:16S rRNA (uracil1498-N3)-methyltransferase
MSMPIARVFIKDLSANNFELDKNTSHHLKNVLRMQPGEKIIVFDGQGSKFSATINISGKKTSICKHEPISVAAKPKLELHLVQTISRKERMAFCIQKAVECGVSAITPVFSALSEVKLNHERLEKKMQHWQEVIIYACEQCGQDWLPTLHRAVQLNDFIQNNASGLVCLPGATLTTNQLEKNDNYTILIGPESGFSESEESLFKQKDWQSISLGPLILRTETAGIVALTQLHWLSRT